MEPVWKNIFIEIALRAMRRLHLDYGLWGLGQEFGSNLNFETLNQGPGIEITDETAVCAAITQEFINSRFTNGLYINKEPRHNEILREISFTSSSRNLVDIFIDRYEKKDNLTYYFRYPAFIQAKRVHYFTPEIATGSRKSKKENGRVIIV